MKYLGIGCQVFLVFLHFTWSLQLMVYILLDYPGANGPIISMWSGVGKLEGLLFIGGAFNNYPAIVMWTLSDMGYRNANNTGKIIVVGNNGNKINGLVTSISQVSILNI